jgi:hypothetical protein
VDIHTFEKKFSRTVKKDANFCAGKGDKGIGRRYGDKISPVCISCLFHEFFIAGKTRGFLCVLVADPTPFQKE